LVRKYVVRQDRPDLTAVWESQSKSKTKIKTKSKTKSKKKSNKKSNKKGRDKRKRESPASSKGKSPGSSKGKSPGNSKKRKAKRKRNTLANKRLKRDFDSVVTSDSAAACAAESHPFTLEAVLASYRMRRG